MGGEEVDGGGDVVGLATVFDALLVELPGHHRSVVADDGVFGGYLDRAHADTVEGDAVRPEFSGQGADESFQVALGRDVGGEVHLTELGCEPSRVG